MTNKLRRDIFLLLLFFIFIPNLSYSQDLDIWWKRNPEDTVWQECIEYRDSTGISPITHYIPDGAIIVIRDHKTWSLIFLTK